VDRSISELEHLVDGQAARLATLQIEGAKSLTQYESLNKRLISHIEAVSDPELENWIIDRTEGYKAVRAKMNKAFDDIAQHQRTNTDADPKLRRIFLERALELQAHAIAETEIHNRYLKRLVNTYKEKAASLGLPTNAK
jgi:hypothetical protein